MGKVSVENTGTAKITATLHEVGDSLVDCQQCLNTQNKDGVTTFEVKPRNDETDAAFILKLFVAKKNEMSYGHAASFLVTNVTLT